MSDNSNDAVRKTVDLYVVDIRELEPYVGILSDKLCRNRQAKMDAYLRADDRLRCLGGGLLMRLAFGTDDVSQNQYGKPTLTQAQFHSHAPRQFNLSHSGDYVVLAVSDAAVGVDIEQMLELDYSQLAKICFHADERAYLDTAPNADKRLLFYKLWTLKESYIKAVGMGFSIAPDSFAMCLDDTGRTSLPTHPECHFFTQIYMSDYALSICAVSPCGFNVVRHERHASDFLNLK